MPLENCHERKCEAVVQRNNLSTWEYENKTRRRSVSATDKSGQSHRCALSIIMRFIRTLYIYMMHLNFEVSC